MKAFIAVSCACCVAGSVLADPYSAAIKQAKDVSAKVTRADEASLQSTAPASPPPTSPRPDPVLEATLRNIAGLRADFAALGDLAGTNSLATQNQLLMNDLATAAQGTKPSSASISRLADDLATAIAGKLKADAIQQKLAQDIHAIFNSSHLSPAQQQMIFDSVQKILLGSGAAPEDATHVVNDIKQIAAETK
jgi:hypothetical protein